MSDLRKASFGPSVLEPLPPTLLQQITAGFLYGLMSLLTIFFNKIVLTTYKFPSFYFVTLNEAIVSIVVLSILKNLRIIRYPDFSWDIFYKIFPLPFIYILNTLTGLAGTQRINIPMLTALRRFAILFTMIGESKILGNKFSAPVKMSVALMIGGAMIAALDDFAFDMRGYLFIMANNLFTAANGVLMKKTLNSKELGTFGLIFYNTLFSLPLLLLMAPFHRDELQQVFSFHRFASPTFQLLYLLTISCGVSLTYSIYYCTKVNSPLSTTVIGCLKNVLSTYLGMFIGGDYIFSATNFIGVNVGIIGSLIYSGVKYQQGLRQSDPYNAAKS
eukprot:Colp12_sorted_trinity150504_noHs@6957